MLNQLRQYVRVVGRRDLSIAIVLHATLATFLAHGYDFRVNYVAGRNVAQGLSPYSGGFIDGPYSAGYGRAVQGIGETPLWTIYTGVAYILSGGDIFLFNLVSKIPILLANFLISYLAHLQGIDGRFFLFNPFMLLVTASWGKPDNLATLLVILPLVNEAKGVTASYAASISLMVKPLGLPLLPGYVAYLRHRRGRELIKFFAGIALLTPLLFLTPFIIFGWTLEEVVGGLTNWLKPAGGISPFNILEALEGATTLPDQLVFLGMLPPISVLTLTFVGYFLPATTRNRALTLSLLGSLTFFSLRPWVSEQNLYLILTLFAFLRGTQPPKLLWIIPLLFSVANLSLPQQLYLIRPSIVDEMHSIDNVVRLWIKFGLSIAWLALVWKAAISSGLLRWRG